MKDANKIALTSIEGNITRNLWHDEETNKVLIEFVDGTCMKLDKGALRDVHSDPRELDAAKEIDSNFSPQPDDVQLMREL